MVDANLDFRVLATELVKRVNDETRRTRLLEQRMDRFEAEVGRIESSVEAQNVEIKSRIETLSGNLKSLSDRISVIENSISRIEKELAKRATKGEIKQMEAYISLMSPITSKFVTREELERVVDEKMSKRY